MKNTINIRPTVGYLSVLSRINYTPWHAMAEFVDNSIQSYIDNKSRLKQLHSNYKLKIEIYVSSSVIEIKDNAAGIDQKNYERAFQAAMRPKKTEGLSEFGMGMKTAAGWFSNLWSVKSKALGEDFATQAKFDIEKITEEMKDDLAFEMAKMPKNTHYTIITLKDLNHKILGKASESVQNHLGSMYRGFIDKDEIEIRYNGKLLKHKSFEILKAPSYKDLDDEIVNPKKIVWKKKFEFDFPLGCEHKNHKVSGFAAICDPGDSKKAGFSVFRRDRMLFGSDEKAWRPLKLIRQEGSSISRRLFGELHFDDDMEVTHTKDNLNWTMDEEQTFLTKLKSVLDSDDMPLIRQADRFRKEIHTPEITRPKSKPTKIRSRNINFQGDTWTVDVILNNDKEIENKKWLDYSFDKKGKNKQVEIQILMNKGFSSQYFGNDEKEIEGMLSLLCYIVLAEIIGKQRGFRDTHMVREYINAIIDSVPPTIN